MTNNILVCKNIRSFVTLKSKQQNVTCFQIVYAEMNAAIFFQKREYADGSFSKWTATFTFKICIFLLKKEGFVKKKEGCIIDFF